MAVREVLAYPHPILRTRAELVPMPAAELDPLITDLIETMHESRGVGIAAPQIGVSRRIFIASPTGVRGQELVAINPELSDLCGVQVGPEGCLSVPGLFAEVKRAQTVTLRALGRDGRPFERRAEALVARIFQHEVDHLNGMLFFDRLSYFRRRQFLKQFRAAVHAAR